MVEFKTPPMSSDFFPIPHSKISVDFWIVHYASSLKGEI